MTDHNTTREDFMNNEQHRATKPGLNQDFMTLSRRAVLAAGAAGLALPFLGGRVLAASKDTLVVTSGADAVTLDC